MMITRCILVRRRPTFVLVAFFTVLGIAGPADAAPEGTPCTLQPTLQKIDYGSLITCGAKSGDKPVQYQLHSRVGETISVQLSGELLRPGIGFPCLQILDSDGAVVAGDYRHCGLRVRIDWTMPASDDYRLVVNTDAVTELRYALSLERVSPATPGTPVMTSGVGNDALDIAGDVDLTVVPAMPDDVIRATITPTEATGAISCLDVIGPDGRSMGGDRCGLGSITLERYARIAGPHIIRVSTENFRRLPYRLEVACQGTCMASDPEFVDGNRPCEFPRPMVIAPGDVIICKLEVATEVHDYAFRGIGGTTIAAHISHTGLLAVPCIELLDDADKSLKKTCGLGVPAAAQLVMPLPTDGIFRLRVTKGGGNPVLSYILAFHQLTGATDAAMILAPSRTIYDRLPAPGALRTFRFKGEKRTTVLISGYTPDWPAALVLELYRSNGTLLARVGNPSSATASLLTTLPQTDTYSVLVYDPTRTFLTYSVTLHQLTPPSSASTKLTSIATGKIRNYGDQQLYLLDWERGSTVSLMLSGISGGSVCAEVYDPLGTLIANDCVYHRLTVRVAISGTYAVVVREGGIFLTGRVDYTLRVTCATSCAPVQHTMTSIIQELPVGVVGVSYPEQHLLAYGGAPAYRWSLESGTLPPGITLSEYDGVLIGTPERADRFDFVIAITDATMQSFRRAFSIRITAQPMTCSVVSSSGARITCNGKVVFEGGYGAGGGRGINVVVLNRDGTLRFAKNFDTWGRGQPAFQEFFGWMNPLERGSLILLACGDECGFGRWRGTDDDPIEQTIRLFERLGAHFVRRADGFPNIGYRDSYVLISRNFDGLALGERVARYDQTTGWANLVLDVHFPLDVAPHLSTIDPTTLRIINETSPDRRPTFRVNDRWSLEVQNTQPNALLYLHVWYEGQDLGISGPYGGPVDASGTWMLTGVHTASAVGFWNIQAIVPEVDRSDIICFEIIGQ